MTNAGGVAGVHLLPYGIMQPFDIGQTVRFRIRYYIDQPGGTTCTP